MKRITAAIVFTAALFFAAVAAKADDVSVSNVSYSMAVPSANLPDALPSDTLVDQPVNPLDDLAVASRDDTATTDDLYVADDVTNTKDWVVRNLFAYNWTFSSPITCVDSITFQIYRDAAGVPDGYPNGGGNPPFWQVTVNPADPQVSLGTNMHTGTLSTLRVDLDEPFLLPAGDHWLVFFTTQDAATCSSFWHVTAGTYGKEAVVFSPTGWAGFPATWTPLSASPFAWIGYTDMTLRLGGEECPGAVFNQAAGTLTIPEVQVDGSDTCYDATLNKSDAGYEFSVANAAKVPCACPAATFTSATGILAIPYIEIPGVAKTYNVELTKKLGVWVFVLSKVNK